MQLHEQARHEPITIAASMYVCTYSSHGYGTDLDQCYPTGDLGALQTATLQPAGKRKETPFQLSKTTL